jgi:YD repeat-containing protein
VASTGNGWSFGYDANGNQTSRNVGGEYSLTYDAENHLTAVSWQGGSASFAYDGDGNRVKGTVGNVTTIYIGNYFEWNVSTGSMIKYYYAGTTRIAMREGSTLYWLLGDHLSSTSRVANANGTPYTNGEQRYKLFGLNVGRLERLNVIRLMVGLRRGG